MYMVTEGWFPVNKAAEVGKLYLEVMKKFPEDRSIEKPRDHPSIVSILEL